MQHTRFLLPFTESIDLGALAYAVQFVRSRQATLVPLALIPLEDAQRAKGPRLEAIEQANDFLQAVTYQAKRAGVPIEPYVSETRNVMRSIVLFSQELLCEGVLLFLRGGTTRLLSADIVTDLVEQEPCLLCLVRLFPSVRAGAVPTLLAWCSKLISRMTGRSETPSPRLAQAVPAGELITLLPARRPPSLLVQEGKGAS
jgi:hypothetical protein